MFESNVCFSKIQNVLIKMCAFAKNSKTFDLKVKMRDVLIKYFQNIDTLILKTDKRFFKNE